MGNTSGVSVIIFFKIFKISARLQNYQKEIKKNFFVSYNYPTTFLGVSNFGST